MQAFRQSGLVRCDGIHIKTKGENAFSMIVDITGVNYIGAGIPELLKESKPM